MTQTDRVHLVATIATQFIAHLNSWGQTNDNIVESVRVARKIVAETIKQDNRMEGNF